MWFKELTLVHTYIYRLPKQSMKVVVLYHGCLPVHKRTVPPSTDIG
jgi:hypothetical protein